MAEENNKYKMSFTLGGLFYHESQIAAELFKKEKNWQEVKNKILSDNLFQTRSLSSLKRITKEVISRLEVLNDFQVSILISGNVTEKNQMLWTGVCKKYLFIRDFAVEIIREKFLMMDFLLKDEDFLSFYEKKSQWHENLENLKDSTRKKIKSVLFKIMREAEIINKENLIIPVIFTKNTAKAIFKDNQELYRIFPVSTKDFKDILK